MSHILSLEVPEAIYESLVRTAQQSGQLPESLAIQWLAQATDQVIDDPVEQFIGAFDSGGTDWADRHDQYLGLATVHRR